MGEAAKSHYKGYGQENSEGSWPFLEFTAFNKIFGLKSS